jgi:hypothetical protein
MQGSSNHAGLAKSSRREDSIHGAALAGGMCLLVGLPAPWVALFGFALAAIPGAAVLGWWFGPRVVEARGRRELVVLAILVGGLAATAGVLVYVWATMLVSLLPGSNVQQPETPFGYVLLAWLSVATLGPFLAVPAVFISGVWGVLLRRRDGNRWRSGAARVPLER